MSFLDFKLKILFVFVLYTVFFDNVHICVNGSATENSGLEILNLGVLYSGSGIFQSYGATVKPITDAWALSQKRYPVNLVYCDVKSNLTLVRECTEMLLQKNVSVIIPAETTLGIPTIQMAQKQQIPIISSMAASSDVYFTGGQGALAINATRKYNHLFGVMTPAQNYFDTLLPIAANHGYTKLSVLSLDTTPDSDVCDGVKQAAAYLEFELLDYVKVSSTTPDSTLQDIVSTIQSKNPETLVVCHRTKCEQILKFLYNTGVSPAILAMFECATTLSANSQTLQDPILKIAAQFIFSPTQWDKRLRGVMYTDTLRGSDTSVSPLFPYQPPNGLTSAEQFYNWCMNLTGGTINSLVASQLATLYTLDAAVMQCNCTHREGILNELSRVVFRSFYGPVLFDQYGQNSGRELIILQLDQQLNQQVVSPATSISSDYIIPMPSWSERVYQFKYFNTDVEVVVFILIQILCVICFTLIFLVLKFKENPMIRGTSYVFVVISLIGWCIFTFSLLSWRIDNAVEDCSLRVGLIIGLVLILNPWIAKTIRIALIFEWNVTQRKVITDLHVGLTTIMLSIPVIILSLLLFVWSPLELENYRIDTLRPAKDLHDCSGSSSSTAIVWCIICYFAVLIIFSLFLSYKLRHVDTVFNDSEAAVYLMCIILICGLIIIVNQAAQDVQIKDLEQSQKTNFIIRGFAVLFACGFSIVTFVWRIARSTKVVRYFGGTQVMSVGKSGEIVINKSRIGVKGVVGPDEIVKSGSGTRTIAESRITDHGPRRSKPITTDDPKPPKIIIENAG